MYAIRSYYALGQLFVKLESTSLIGMDTIVESISFFKATSPAFVITSYSIHYTKLYEFLISNVQSLAFFDDEQSLLAVGYLLL